jgi:hypothetical protein
MTPPSFDDHLCLEKCVKDLSVKKQVSHLSVKRLAVTILPRASGFDVERFNADIFKPFAKFSCYELRAIVGAYVLGNSMLDKKISQNQDHILTANAPRYE